MGASVAEPAGTIKRARSGEGLEAFDLVCACLAPGPRELPDAGAVDPQRLAQVARRHQVSALVAARLAAAGRSVPEPLRRQAEAAHHRALRQMGLVLELVETLAGAGISAVPVKGVALSQQAFGSPLLRGAVDIDLLVRPQNVGPAWAVLARSGWTQRNPPAPLEGARLALFCRAAKDSLHQHADSGQMLELHWRLSDGMTAPLIPPDGALGSVTLAPGRSVPALNDPTQFLYLCTHGAAHGWARIKWLADVAALLHRAPDRGRALWAHASLAGGAVAAGSAVILSQELFGLAPPPGFAAPRGWRLSALLWLARRTIRAGDGMRELETTPWRGWAEMLALLLTAANWRSRLSVVRRLALAGEDIAQVPLPRGAFWLYPLLRVPLLVRRRIARRQRLRGSARVGNTAR